MAATTNCMQLFLQLRVKNCGAFLPQRLSRREVNQLREDLRSGQRGQGMVEYALILVLVSIVVIVILLTMGQQIANVFSNVVGALGS